MIGLRAETRVWLANGATDMRRSFDGLALLVQGTLKRDPHCGHLFVFRGRRGGLIKVLWHDGQGMCLLAKRLERGRFVWPRTDDHGGAARLGARGVEQASSGGRSRLYRAREPAKRTIEQMIAQPFKAIERSAARLS